MTPDLGEKKSRRRKTKKRLKIDSEKSIICLKIRIELLTKIVSLVGSLWEVLQTRRLQSSFGNLTENSLAVAAADIVSFFVDRKDLVIVSHEKLTK